MGQWDKFFLRMRLKYSEIAFDKSAMMVLTKAVQRGCASFLI